MMIRPYVLDLPWNHDIIYSGNFEKLSSNVLEFVFKSVVTMDIISHYSHMHTIL